MILRTVAPLLLLFIWTGPALSISRSDLYPFDSTRDHHLNDDMDDVSSLEVQLSVPIVFYGTSYDTIFVNDNGLLSFLTEVPSFFNAQFPLSYPIIAPLYCDIDTRGTGRVYYRETQSPELVERATSDIRKHFSGAGNFQTRSLFIATWDSVGAYDRKTGLTNTFQVVIASNGEDSYVIFLYPEGGVQWIQGQGKNPNLADARAQAGFMPGDGRLFTLRGSGTDQTKNLDRMSNVRKPGVWLFHVGQTGPGGNVLPADKVEGGDEQDRPQSCASAQVPCPPTATCIDYNNGFCCKCKDEYYGNGRSCIEKDKPHRMNGKVNGILNDVRLENVDLHSYIVTNDGRTYTAIRRIPPSLGYDIQALFTLGGVIGWMFATTRVGAANGFTITGGAFQRSTEIEFPGTGHHVHILEEFEGPDVFNFMRVNIQLTGSLPSIPSDKKIEVRDHEEEFTRTTPGQLRSRSNKSYRLEGNTLEVPLVVDQTITYEEQCNLQGGDPLGTNSKPTRLKLARNFVTYDAAEEIVRFASTSKISPTNSEDPCKEGLSQCGANSRCVAEGDTFRCVCDRGYEHVFQQQQTDSEQRPTCVDINECLVGKDNCHVNAECINLPGVFNCRCLQGYTGDGRQCQRTRTCEDLSCDLNGECVQESAGPSCRCLPGYEGDGQHCSPRDEHGGDDKEEDDCRQVDFCDAHADCVYSAATGNYQCRCQAGFQGDGLVCLRGETCDITDDCHPDASCYYDEVFQGHRCLCNPGYDGDGYTCTAQGLTQSCNVLNNCHPWAQCVYDAQQEQFACRCQAGYVGDGYRCTKNEETTCKEVNLCSLFGKCQLDRATGRHACVCNDGYQGDGITCDPVDECNTVENCDENAQCIYDSAGQRYRCRCNTGFTGSGKTCNPEGEASCHVVPVCHANAQCVYDTVDLKYRCQCLPGYEGDGTYCQPKIVSCNVLNNCHLYAECTYDPESQGHRCRCREGYEGDGHICRLTASCNEDPFICDVHADCLPASAAPGYKCQCKEGYTGDGIVCSVTPQHSGDFLLFAHGMSLLRMPFQEHQQRGKDGKGRLLLMEPSQTAVGVDVDCLKGNVYWTDMAHKAIRRAAYNGSNAEIVFDTGLKSPEGLAVDWSSRNLYWADSEKDTIEVLRLETLDHKVLIDQGLVNPRGVALHAGVGKLYWSDWNRAAPKIESANLDGNDRAVFVADNLGLPNMITVDYEKNALCWTDAGLHRLECVNLNGQQRRLIFTPAAYPFGITVAGGYIYWTDWDTDLFIQRVDRNGGNAEPIEVPLGGNGKLYGITTVPSQCPRVRNPCAAQNGGCRHLCLPNGRGGRTCACPDDEEACNSL